MGLMKELNDLNSIYLKMHEQEVSEDQDKGYVVTRADKKGNTPAWQGYKAGKKNVKTGKPLYRAADHLKNEEAEVEVDEGYGKIKTPEKVVGKVRQPKKVAAPKGSKMKEEIDAIEHYLNELKKTTLASYAKKATTDLANRSFDHGESEKRMYEPDKEDEKEEKKQATRKKGIDRAIDKLAKEDIEIVTKLVESGKFSDAEIAKISNLQEADIADILARLEKKRISKGGDPEESPLPAMRKYHADKKKKAKK